MRGSPFAMARWLFWIPVVMVASLFYWTVALGLGGLSLMAVSALSGSDGALALPFAAPAPEGDTATVAPPHDGFEVQLEESVEPEDVDDNAGAATNVTGPRGERVDPVNW
jgi:hypothetical protein